MVTIILLLILHPVSNTLLTLPPVKRKKLLSLCRNDSIVLLNHQQFLYYCKNHDYFVVMTEHYCFISLPDPKGYVRYFHHFASIIFSMFVRYSSCFNHFIQNHWTNLKSNVTELLFVWTAS